MGEAKGKTGAVEVFLPRDYANSLLTVLSCIVEADGTNRYGMYAAKIKNKILAHGRTFIHEEEENVAIYFYEKEAAMLIYFFSLYAKTTQKKLTDFFPQIGK